MGLIQTCYHEAGHAVAAELLGFKVEKIRVATWINQGGRYAVWGRVEFAGTGQLERFPRADAVMSYAGPCAQSVLSRVPLDKLFFGPRGYDSDFGAACRAVERLWSTNDDCVEAHEKAEALAFRLVRQHWRLIDRVAKRLIARRFMGGNELRRLTCGVSTTPPAPTPLFQWRRPAARWWFAEDPEATAWDETKYWPEPSERTGNVD
jgi:hypothetical protein